MSQKKMGCLQFLFGLIVIVPLSILLCTGMMSKGTQMIQDAADKRAAEELAKSPEQKAKEKQDAAEATLETQLTSRARISVEKALEYPLNSTIHLRTQYGKKGNDTRAIIGKVDASNAFGVKKTMEWMVLFKKDGENWTEITPVVFKQKP